jgi:hypothetical protein
MEECPAVCAASILHGSHAILQGSDAGHSHHIGPRRGRWRGPCPLCYTRNFCGMVSFAGEGLRSVGAESHPPSKEQVA